MTASSTSFAHGTAITISGTVTGTGTPTGNVALMTDSTEPVQTEPGRLPARKRSLLQRHGQLSARRNLQHLDPVRRRQSPTA